MIIYLSLINNGKILVDDKPFRAQVKPETEVFIQLRGRGGALSHQIVKLWSPRSGGLCLIRCILQHIQWYSGSELDFEVECLRMKLKMMKTIAKNPGRSV